MMNKRDRQTMILVMRAIQCIIDTYPADTMTHELANEQYGAGVGYGDLDSDPAVEIYENDGSPVVMIYTADCAPYLTGMLDE